jgi:hypothetical protein
MKAILEIPKQNIKVEFKNFNYSTHRQIESIPSEKDPAIIEYFPIGDLMHIVTSNVPLDLQNKIDKLMEQYCKPE